ncbi:MAG: DUF362 domain-containing protein [Candidatus Omnitrophota bacterium]
MSMIEKIAVYKQGILSYPKNKPYFPRVIYPEYPFDDPRTDKTNAVYGSLREALRLLGLDQENFNTKSWNPFSSFISPGQTVLIKPNFVRHFNDLGGVECLITHGSVIRAAVDYAYIALRGRGRIVIADGPMDEGDFDKIADMAGVNEIRDFYKAARGFNLEIYDLRRERVIKKDNRIIERIKLRGDPLGYTAVNLRDNSEFKRGGLDYKTFKGSECIDEVMFSHHNKERDEYLIANTFLKADAVISIPKMKTHRKAGVTLSLKNMVGVTGDRNWLPHFSGSFSGNGGQAANPPRIPMCRAAKMLKCRLRYLVGRTDSDVRAGDWHGNDIMWRTIVDLARIGAYVDAGGVERRERQRGYFVIVDGIIGGECDGPVSPLPKPCGVLVAGRNEFCADLVSARLMGFDPARIPKLRNIMAERPNRMFDAGMSDIICVSNVKKWDRALSDFRGRCLGFKPYFGWKGHIEAD